MCQSQMCDEKSEEGCENVRKNVIFNHLCRLNHAAICNATRRCKARETKQRDTGSNMSDGKVDGYNK